MCSLPQKQYVLKVDKSLNFKIAKNEKKSIHHHTLPLNGDMGMKGI
jgi:hypothetical protein